MPGVHPTVFLIEDDPPTQDLYETIITSAGHRVMCFTSSYEFASNGSHDYQTGCVLLDIKHFGLEHQQMLSKSTTLPLIIISDSHDIHLAVQSIKSGAVDYLLKPVDELELLQSVDQAIAQSRTDDLHRAQSEAITQRLNTLTPREREVMMLVIKGLPNKLIAHTLGAAEKTIKVHRGRVMKKMEVCSIAELVHDVDRVL